MMNRCALKRCGRCGRERLLIGWPRYHNGRRTVFCAECNGLVAAKVAANEAAHIAGYSDASHTPEGKRVSRERAASREGRGLPEYLTRTERRRQALMLEVERNASVLRSRWWRHWLWEAARGMRAGGQ